MRSIFVVERNDRAIFSVAGFDVVGVGFATAEEAMKFLARGGMKADDFHIDHLVEGGLGPGPMAPPPSTQLN